MAIITNRRGFLTGLGTLLIAAPAIVRVTSIMPVKALSDDLDWIYDDNEAYTYIRTGLPSTTWRSFNMGIPYVKTL